MSKNLLVELCTIECFHQRHFGKSVFLIPAYLSALHGYESEIVICRQRMDVGLLPPAAKVRLRLVDVARSIARRRSKLNGFLPGAMAWRCRKVLARSKVMMLLHPKLGNLLAIIIFKLINPSGQVYLKLDSNPRWLSECLDATSYFGKMIARVRDLMFSACALISVESIESLEAILRIGRKKAWVKRVVRIPNAFDDLGLVSNPIQVQPFEMRSDLILFVGRIGTRQKNVGMILRALEATDLHDYSVEMVGAVEPKFDSEIDGFFKRRPDLRGRVTFTGFVASKEELYRKMNRAKVLMLSSQWEGFATVLIEAIRFGLYIVGTDVGGVRDVTCAGKCGAVVTVADEEGFANALQNIVIGVVPLSEASVRAREVSTRGYVWSRVSRDLAESLQGARQCGR